MNRHGHAFICSKCGNILHDSAVCIECDNKKSEKEQSFKDLIENIAGLIKASRTHMRATLKNSGFRADDLDLDPSVRSLLGSGCFYKPRNVFYQILKGLFFFRFFIVAFNAYRRIMKNISAFRANKCMSVPIHILSNLFK